VLGGGGIAEQDSAVLGGGGMAEQDESTVAGGGGMAEQDSAVLGGGGMAEQDESTVAGGGGMAEQDESTVAGGGGMAEQDSAVLGGGGIIGAERAGLLAVDHEYCPAGMNVRPSSSPRSEGSSSLWLAGSAGNPANRAALAPNFIQLMVRLLSPFRNCPEG